METDFRAVRQITVERITNGSLTIPKPVGTIELKLVKEGYVTKKYTLTMDTEEENSIFRFPEMTPEN